MPPFGFRRCSLPRISHLHFSSFPVPDMIRLTIFRAARRRWFSSRSSLKRDVSISREEVEKTAKTTTKSRDTTASDYYYKYYRRETRVTRPRFWLSSGRHVRQSALSAWQRGRSKRKRLDDRVRFPQEKRLYSLAIITPRGIHPSK